MTNETTVSKFPTSLEWEDGLLTDGQGALVMCGGIDNDTRLGWRRVEFYCDDEQADMLRRGIEKLGELIALLRELRDEAELRRRHFGNINDMNFEPGIATDAAKQVRAIDPLLAYIKDGAK